jgi:hypothetical protein
VPNPLFKPPRHLVKEWPEVFEDLYMNTMPVAYLELVHFEFKDGRIWAIDVKEEINKTSADEFAQKLFDMMTEYKEDIIKLDFKIDIDRLKHDILDSTKTIL